MGGPGATGLGHTPKEGQGCGRELGCISANRRSPPFLGGPLFQVNGRGLLTVFVSSGYVTDYHKLGLKTIEIYRLSVLEPRSQKSRRWQGHTPPRRWGKTGSVPVSYFLVPPVILGVPWLMAASLCLDLCCHMAFSLCVPAFSFCKDVAILS